jgi:hypothetical protein
VKHHSPPFCALQLLFPAIHFTWGADRFSRDNVNWSIGLRHLETKHQNGCSEHTQHHCNSVVSASASYWLLLYLTTLLNWVDLLVRAEEVNIVGGKIRGSFAKFVDSPYYSESELCGGAVTVSISKYLPCQAMHFLQRFTHFSKTCCRPLITSKFLASELPFHGWKSSELAWGRDLNLILCSAWKCESVKPHQNIRNTIQILPHAISGLFQLRKGSFEARNFEVLCSTFSRIGWSVVRSASLVKGGTSKKRPSSHLHKVLTRSNKVSPRAFQTAVVNAITEIKESLLDARKEVGLEAKAEKTKCILCSCPSSRMQDKIII